MCGSKSEYNVVQEKSRVGRARVTFCGFLIGKHVIGSCQ